MGIKALRKLQLGAETTAGTAVAADTLWRGLGGIEDQREVIFPDEDIGYLSGKARNYIPKLGAAVVMDAVPATFEALPVILSAGVKNVITGVTDTGGSGKVYTYTFPTTSANSITTWTIEAGDDQQAEEVEYSFVESFEINGNGGEALQMSANWLGRQVTKCSFTGSVTTPATVEEILFGKGKLYIDEASGTIGTTEKSATLLGMGLQVNTGWIPKYAADGQLYFSWAQSTKPEVLLNVTFEHNSTAVAEKDAWKAKTPRQLRLKFEGNALTTAGTFTYKSLIIDLAGLWEKFDVIGDMNGNDIVTGILRAGYDATAAKFASIKVVNEVAAY
jgi:hypothetical protein